MERVGKFEIVSLEQFTKDWIEKFPLSDEERMEGVPLTEVFDAIGSIYVDIKKPVRSTAGSAGYDIFTPIDIELAPGSEIFFPLGIRCKIKPGWCLMIIPRSGQGTKFRLRLANTVGLIDSDYYNADNEGHIMAKLCNEGDRMFTVEAGKAIAQAVFVPYGITEDDDVTDTRTGGFGSTDNTEGNTNEVA